jgi:hypothetical protein
VKNSLVEAADAHGATQLSSVPSQTERPASGVRARAVSSLLEKRSASELLRRFAESA